MEPSGAPCHHPDMRNRIVAGAMVALCLTACGAGGSPSDASKAGSSTLLRVQMLEYGGPSATNLAGAEARASHSTLRLRAGSKTFVVTGDGNGLASIDLHGFAGTVTIPSDGACAPKPNRFVVPARQTVFVNVTCAIG